MKALQQLKQLPLTGRKAWYIIFVSSFYFILLVAIFIFLYIILVKYHYCKSAASELKLINGVCETNLEGCLFGFKWLILTVNIDLLDKPKHLV